MKPISMNAALTGFTLLVTSFAAHAETLVATCQNTQPNQSPKLLCIYDVSSPESNWKSIRITWKGGKDCDDQTFAGITYTRQFVQNEVKHNDTIGIDAKQGSVFLGFGRKTKFSFDRAKRTAEVKGKNGSLLQFGQELSAPAEKKGRYDMTFENCR